MRQPTKALSLLPAKSAFAAEVQAIVSRQINHYFTPDKPTIKACYQMVQAEIAFENDRRRVAGKKELIRPSFLRFNLALSLERHARLAGPNFSSTQPMNTHDFERFGARVQFETVILDGAFLGLPSLRFQACFGFDMATGYVTAVSIAPAGDGKAPLKAFRMTMCDKSDTAARAGAVGDWSLASKPEIIEFHEGVFDWPSVREAAAKLGVMVEQLLDCDRGHCPAFIRMLQQTWSADAINADETLRAEIDKGDSNTFLRAIEEYFVRQVCDHYHDHSLGQLGQSVREVASQSMLNCGALPVPNREILRIAFGAVTCRRVHKGGVVVMGRSYASPSLAAMERNSDDSLTLLVDLEDPSAISVKNGDAWVTVECVPDFSEPLSTAELDEFEEKIAQCFKYSEAMRYSNAARKRSGDRA